MTSFSENVTAARARLGRLSNEELRAVACAALAELAARRGATETVSWAEIQTERLRSLDAVTA